MEKNNNIEHNKDHYNAQYSNVNIGAILAILENVETYLNGATTTDISWVGLYYDGLKTSICGKKILELGCGDCVNVAIMAALGAEVYANDISDRSEDIIAQLNDNYDFELPITFVSGDFTTSNLPNNEFDIILGKAFLHHLTIDYERQVLELVAKLLKSSGHARFFEPAINSKFLDAIRWAIPLRDRPSKLFQPKAFQYWEKKDPHPTRDNSSSHFKKVGGLYFQNIRIVPFGILERFYRVLPPSKNKNAKFKRIALNLENYLPAALRLKGARSQLIIYKNPKR